MAAVVGSSELPAHSLAEQLAVYADGLRFEDLDAATIERVKTHIIDTIGCGIGAFDERPVRIAATSRLRSAVTQPLSARIGTRHLTLRPSSIVPLSATSTSMTHTSEALPFIQAIILRRASRFAEVERASAQDLIASIVIAYEVNCRLVDAFDITMRGWDPPVMSLPAVALAAAKLMKLGPDRLTHAVNLASTTIFRWPRPACRRCLTGRGSRMPKRGAMRYSPHCRHEAA